jgi:hypothetical protein
MYSPLDENRDVMAWENFQKPFPFQNRMNYEDLEQLGEELGVYSREGDEHIVDQLIDHLINGYFWVSYTGCQCWYMLVITGPTRGQIWYVDGLTVFTPVVLRDGEPDFHFDPEEPQEPRVTFTEWYEAWLNKQIRIAQEHWQKRGRVVPPLVMD